MRRPTAFPALLATLGLAVGPGLQTARAETAEWPAVDASAFALRNAHFATPLRAFDEKGRDLMAFSLATRERALFGRFHDLVCAGGSFHARDAGAWVGMQVAKSGAFTAEATLTPAPAPTAAEAPRVVLAYANDEAEDFALLQGPGGLAFRLRGSAPIDLFAMETGKTVHVLLACGKGQWAVYRDGQPVQAGALPGPAPAWGTRELVLGGPWAGTNVWRGRMEGIAVFPRALDATQAAAEAAAMRAVLAERKPAAAVRFRGKLAQQAKTSSIEAIRPYTRSLTAAEYKVEQVLAGQWDKPTITVLHWMIMESRRLPIADRQPGETVELTVESLVDHPQLESCRRDDLPDTDPEAEVFYCESESAP